jgi:hypothetical protein
MYPALEVKQETPNNMSKKISDLSMTPADNGVIISYCKKVKSESGGSYDNCRYEYPKEVFGVSEIDNAFKRFKELLMKGMGKEEDMEEDD